MKSIYIYKYISFLTFLVIHKKQITFFCNSWQLLTELYNQDIISTFLLLPKRNKNNTKHQKICLYFGVNLLNSEVEGLKTKRWYNRQETEFLCLKSEKKK